MKTQIINFIQKTPCFSTFGPCMKPHILHDVDYEVSNLVVYKQGYITFDLYDEQGYIGHYIAFNVSLRKNDDGSMDAHSTVPDVYKFEWDYVMGYRLC